MKSSTFEPGLTVYACIYDLIRQRIIGITEVNYTRYSLYECMYLSGVKQQSLITLNFFTSMSIKIFIISL